MGYFEVIVRFIYYYLLVITMKTYIANWDLGHLFPRRDIACLDMEDWPEDALRSLYATKPEYTNYVTHDMIVGESYVTKNNDCEDKDYPEQNVTPLTLQDLVKMRDDFRKTSDDRWADELDAVIAEYNVQ